MTRQSQNFAVSEITNQVFLTSISQKNDFPVTAQMTEVTSSWLLLLSLAILPFSEYPMHFGNVDLPLPNLQERSCKSLDCFSNHTGHLKAKRKHSQEQGISFRRHIYKQSKPVAKVNPAPFSEQLVLQSLLVVFSMPKVSLLLSKDHIIHIYLFRKLKEVVFSFSLAPIVRITCFCKYALVMLYFEFCQMFQSWKLTSDHTVALFSSNAALLNNHNPYPSYNFHRSLLCLSCHAHFCFAKDNTEENNKTTHKQQNSH